MCLHLFGNPDSVAAFGVCDAAAGVDLIGAHLEYAAGPAVEIRGGWYAPGEYPFSMSYSVAMEGGSVEYSSAGTPPVLYPRNGPAQALPLESADAYAAEIAYFAACCREGRRPDRCPPEESALAVKWMRLLLDSRQRNGAKIVCNL